MVPTFIIYTVFEVIIPGLGNNSYVVRVLLITSYNIGQLLDNYYEGFNYAIKWRSSVMTKYLVQSGSC